MRHVAEKKTIACQPRFSCMYQAGRFRPDVAGLVSQAGAGRLGRILYQGFKRHLDWGMLALDTCFCELQRWNPHSAEQSNSGQAMKGGLVLLLLFSTSNTTLTQNPFPHYL